MNRSEPEDAALERRLRSLFGGLDTGPDFSPRLAARLASMRAVPDEPTRARLRAAAEAQRRELEATLRRRLWRTLGLAALLAAGGIAFVRRFGEEAARQLAARLPHADPSAIAIASCVVVGVGVWWLAQQALQPPAPRARAG